MSHPAAADDRPVTRVQLRPTRLNRLVGWGVILVGLGLPLAGLAADAPVGDVVGVALPALALAVIGAGMVRARVTADPEGIEYRTVYTKSIPRAGISGVETVERYGMVPFLRFVSLVVEHDGAATKLSLLDRWATATGRAEQRRYVERVRGALGSAED